MIDTLFFPCGCSCAEGESETLGFVTKTGLRNNMPFQSDSNYFAVARTRRQPVKPGRPVCIVDVVDDDWIKDVLPNDDVDVSRHELLVAPLLEEGELDNDAMVVSPAGNSSATAVGARERRRREEGWNDMGLEQLDGGNVSELLVNNSTAREQAGNSNTN